MMETNQRPTMTKHTTSSRKKPSLLKARKAFSLIELLVVIAVIGIIAAIAIPNIGSLTGGAETAKNQRNAQTITSVCSAAMAAGYVPVGATGTAEVANLTTGVVGPNVPNSTFKLDMDPADYNDAVKGFLTYAPTTGFAYFKGGSATPAN